MSKELKSEVTEMTSVEKSVEIELAEAQEKIKTLTRMLEKFSAALRAINNITLTLD